jgi:hypothetical protein
MNYYTDIQYTGNIIHLAVKIDTSRIQYSEWDTYVIRQDTLQLFQEGKWKSIEHWAVGSV